MEWKLAHKDKVSEHSAKCHQKRRERGVAQAYMKWRKKNDKKFIVVNNLRNRFRYAIKNKSVDKTLTSYELWGCTREFLYNYIESQFTEGMSWDNYGVDGWHIDHIIPMASFNLENIEEQKKCCHYTNLRPLWAHDNRVKGTRICA